jgi:hypothetical protein
MVEKNVFSSHMEVNILHNGNKSVENYIMDPHVVIAMGAMYKVDTHRVDGMCAHTSNEAYN